MRIRGTFIAKEYDKKAFKDAVLKAISIHHRQAIREFIRAAVPKIPVQTGMARGSYLNIGRLLRIAVPITGRSNYRTRTRDGRTWTEFNYWYYPPGKGRRLPKTPASGAALTAFKIEQKGTKFNFILNSRVFHLTLQDELKVRSPTSPWQSMRAGREAYVNYLKTINKRIPKLNDYAITTMISVGQGSGGLSRSIQPIKAKEIPDG